VSQLNASDVGFDVRNGVVVTVSVATTTSGVPVEGVNVRFTV
jgi:hypothetical protein